MITRAKRSYTWLTLGILMVVLSLGWYQFGSAIQVAEMYAEGLNYIEHINASTQRAVKLELLGTPNDELVYHLQNVMEDLTPYDIYDKSHTETVDEIDHYVAEVKSNWDAIYEEIVNVREGGELDKLLFASERHYNTATELNIVTTEKFMEASDHINYIQLFLLVLIILLSFIIFRHLYIAFLAVRHSKELSEKMFIDVSTGLYNRSKCQEMLKDTTTPANHKSRVMIMLDLNDLKITNDKLGHQVGDELIGSFAAILKKAKQIHRFDIFVGRYGGDEFMVYYQSAEEMDAKLYLAEVDFLIEQFNMNETKFQISYAAGYAVFAKENDNRTMRDLFNDADADMYQNKVMMKEAKREREKALMDQARHKEEVANG